MQASYTIARVAVAVFTLLIVFSGCGTKHKGELLSPERQAATFSIAVLEESFVDGASIADVEARVQASNTETTIEIAVTGAAGLKALYYTLTYDPALYHPLAAEACGPLATAGELLTLSVLGEPGTVHHGQVLAHFPARPGFSGDGVLAEVRFAHEAAPALRSASVAPTSDGSAAILTFDGSALEWRYYNQGDYDQNGEVNIADLTPLGINLGAVGPFDPASALSVINGDGNTEINIADITPIGANFRSAAVGGYNVYTSTSTTSFPAANDEPSTIAALDNVAITSATGTPGSYRLAFAYDVADPVDQALYWVRPVDDEGNEGTPSNVAGDPTVVPILSLVTAPISGGGWELDPYVIDVDTTYVFTLELILQGSVAGDGQTVWTVSNPAAGQVQKGATQATLNVEDSFNGTFSVGATYYGIASDPPALYFSVAPVFTLTNPPANGSGTQADPYDADTSTDYVFSLVDPLAGDVSTDANTAYVVSDTGAGAIAAGSATLSIEDSYDGTFNVAATYNGIVSEPPRIWLHAEPLGPGEDPVAAITADPATSDVMPVEVSLDASGSSDPDGTVEYYDWDFDGDGKWDIEDDTDSQIDHWYASTGQFDATVRVTDNDGRTDTESVLVTVTDEGNYWPSAQLTADPTTADVPVTVDFDASGSSDPDGTIAQYLWDLDGDDVYETDTGTTPTTSKEYTEAGQFWVVVRAYDDLGAWDFDEVELTLTIDGNLPPQADLGGAPTYGLVPLLVTFTAGDSLDPDGSIVKYEWDWDGDGSYEDDTGTDPTNAHNYTIPDNYTTVVRVTDDDGATDTAQLTITATASGAEWHLSTIASDAEYETGEYSTMAVVQDKPAVAYMARGDTRVEYKLATDSLGSDWSSAVVVDPGSDTLNPGYDVHLTVVNGNPAVSYGTYVQGSFNDYYLHYSRADSADGLGTWSSPLQLDASTHVGTASFMAIVDANPAVSYRDRENESLKYVRATDASGTAWDTPLTLDASSDVGQDNTLFIADGYPAVAYWDRIADINQDAAMLVRATDATGSNWGSPQVINNTGEVGEFCFGMLLGEYPAVCYGDKTNEKVKFQLATAQDGSTWGAAVDAADSSGWFVFPGENAWMAQIGAMPAITWYNAGDLMYVKATQADGSAWESAQTVYDGDDMGFPGDATLLQIEGRPCIAYYQDGSPGSLCFAIYY